MNEKSIQQPAPPMPDYIADAMRLANLIYFDFYGVKPYPPQGAK